MEGEPDGRRSQGRVRSEHILYNVILNFRGEKLSIDRHAKKASYDLNTRKQSLHASVGRRETVNLFLLLHLSNNDKCVLESPFEP